MSHEHLHATVRTEKGHRARAVAQQRIPAVIYGHGVTPQNVWVNAPEFARIFAHAGETSMIDLSIADKKGVVAVLVRDLQRDPLTYRVTHIDFYQVNMKEEITVEVPLAFIGEAPAVKEQGGTLVHGISEITVRCLPEKLPHAITVDVSSLVDFDQHITVADLSVERGITIETESDILVASVTAPRVVEAEATTETSSAATDTPAA